MSLTARSCRAALRQTGRHNLSTSAVRRRHTLPTFEPSSSPELTALLDTARARLMVPAHLNLAQQHLVYRDAHRARLDPATNPEPYYSTVAGADVALEHLDRQRDIPAHWSVFSRALALAETRADWENVGRLLEGLRDAGVVLKDTWVQKFVREAGAKGQMHVVLRALQRAERTGVRLRSADVVERVMWEVRGVAARSGWGEAETDRAVVLAEQVVELMEREEHCGGRRVEKGDLRTLPFVIATPLELAAVQAVRHREGRDEEGLVKAYAERLCVNLGHYGTQEPATSSDDASSSKPLNRYQRFAQATHKLRRLVPVWHGLTLAQRVLGDSMPLGTVDTYRKIGELREEIQRATDTMQANLREGQSVDNHADYQAWAAVNAEYEA
ncbi:hypothetical protein B0J12DRAFT_450177 [Macrophomina phaseolina]|uniref:Uncharacterized protein n=1 Tax=Macrophomina phaseolina TaxID=35725 RepID=A0ABQ8GFY5_9PEZI|nr:hypothetical protein B0J12DRAFT_450177 [Macrophomina phaseolina]